jgi:hypothetical protein
LRDCAQTTLGAEFSDPLFQRALLDVHMMVVHNGAERTVTEWCAASACSAVLKNAACSEATEV